MLTGDGAWREQGRSLKWWLWYQQYESRMRCSRLMTHLIMLSGQVMRQGRRPSWSKIVRSILMHP